MYKIPTLLCAALLAACAQNPSAPTAAASAAPDVLPQQLAGFDRLEFRETRSQPSLLIATYQQAAVPGVRVSLAVQPIESTTKNFEGMFLDDLASSSRYLFDSTHVQNPDPVIRVADREHQHHARFRFLGDWNEERIELGQELVYWRVEGDAWTLKATYPLDQRDAALTAIQSMADGLNALRLRGR